MKALILCIISVLLFSSCVSTGELFEESYSELSTDKATANDGNKDASDDIEEKAKEKNIVGVRVESTPSRAKIYIDLAFYGETPLLIEDLEAGRYMLVVEKESYIPYSTTFTYTEDTYLFIDIELEARTGILAIDSSVEKADIQVNRQSIGAGSHTMIIGEKLLTAKAFGYEDFQKTVQIRENQETLVSITMTESTFDVRAFNIRQKQFNPRNPGALGNCVMNLYVNSWGSGSVDILNSKSELLRTLQYNDFENTYNSLRWDGRDEYGNYAKDGLYTVILSAMSKDGSIQIQKEDQLTVDSSLVISYKSVYSGSSGLLLVPDPFSLPAFYAQAGLDLSLTGNMSQFIMPLVLSTRFGIGGKRELGLNLYQLITDSTEAISKPGASLSLKQGYTITDFFSLALIPKISYIPLSYSDFFSNYTGIGIAAAAALNVAQVKFLAAQELKLTKGKPYTADIEEPTFALQSYSRAGFSIDSKYLSAGVSAAFRSNNLLTQEFFRPPFQAAANLSFYIPETSFIFGFTALCEFSSIENFMFFGGINLNVILY